MKQMVKTAGLALLMAAGAAPGLSQAGAQSFLKLVDPKTAAQLKHFVEEKERQANASTNEAAPGFTSFFAAAEKGDWLAVSNAFADFRQHAGQYEHAGKTDERLRGTKWQTVMEIWGAFDAFSEGDEKYATAYSRDIINSIPAGSIYFGGTDPGRFLVTAMCRSHVNADPFYVLTQNALADSTYLQYLRDMYGKGIDVPSAEDSRRCFQDYLEDAQKRLQNGQLKPGEDVHKDAHGQVQVGGQVAVMAINGLLVKCIFEHNPKREFYLEESFPLDWMYPQLEPHGLIFKLNREPVSRLSEKVVRRDHEYWINYVRPMIGDWLHDDTSVEEIAAFAEKTFQRRDFSGFKGDPHFIQNAYAHRMYSKLRSSLGGLYAWRLKNAADASDRERMAREADFAFRQAWALCPYLPEAVYRYVEYLVAQDRRTDALRVVSTAAQMPGLSGPDLEQFRALQEKLRQTR